MQSTMCCFHVYEPTHALMITKDHRILFSEISRIFNKIYNCVHHTLVRNEYMNCIIMMKDNQINNSMLPRGVCILVQQLQNSVM